ncbi:ABC transporter, ATP-binding protein (cluster 1, maltose/g3p/polyamine/iron); ABC transporter, ATP-binding protein (cluster 10, nitrate/sulfonate/bicarbonate) [Olavius sp. associated proteobacterium Delta 1]|nr:ABC transporter, ATP-binding protein (cluster 1, maltose/g3p/polyamine/iron); ABC transporter, ATP-binding protein (cluster 10, nitrate/sulfonate/bicarbonate) [Olavius sp. associated proteobacterium Delta 1]
MSNVRLENVCKYFGDVEAVSSFHLDVEDKEFLVLLGPSGCGKSTTLRMIAGLEELSEGNIYIGDKLVNDMPPRDRDIAMVFQDYALYPHMTVRQNMAFGLKLRKFPKSEINQRVDEAAEILGIQELLDRKPRELSGGQRQRVAVGRTIVRKPAVFLFDEPLSNLDAKLRGQMRAELSKLHDQLNTTIIYVTHDQVEAMTMGTKIVIMKDGVVNQVGTPMEIYDFPVNKFVAGFIGNPGMNFLPARIAPKDSTLYVDAGSFQLLIPPEKHSYLQSKAEREVILGIRPEHLQDVAFPDDSKITDSFKAVVEVVETLGAEVQLDVVCGEHNLVARVDPRTTAKRHQERELAVNMDKIHIFETEPPNQRVKTEER